MFEDTDRHEKVTPIDMRQARFATAMIAGRRMRDEERDIEELRHALTDAQVRRARGS